MSEVSEDQSGFILRHGNKGDGYCELYTCKNGLEWAYWPGANSIATYSILVEKANWDLVDPLLGTMSDYALAEKAGCTHCTIHQRRVKFGIQPYQDRPESIQWQDFDKLLGTMNDGDLAKKIGCAETAVRRRRKKLGIQRALGESPKEVLKTLCRCPGWAYGRSREVGWVYGTESRTRKILDGLCHRGLVELQGDKYYPTQAGTDAATM
ncbi:AsnC family protein [Desulfovibrio sp. DV]|uniref:AsnC family protein n=1 Tax=Desulfovibrio sp. DV TaxID=1844708 RepID=UPI000AA0B703|nr:AsnC family protein [Desulfovibrio sp. DV]